MHPAQLPVEQLLTECSLQRTRRGGPGGQHRNKVETAIVIVHEPTRVRAEASERRSQAANRTQALFRLRVRLAIEVRQRERDHASSAPSSLWVRRSGGGKIRVNPRHDDFPALLAEALDAIHRADANVAVAARQLGVTPSQLVKLLKLQSDALIAVNGQRAAHGLSALR